MSTASIEFLIVAPGAGGIAVCLASRADTQRAAAWPAPLPPWLPPGSHNISDRGSDHARPTDTRPRAPHGGSDRNPAETIGDDVTDNIGAEPDASVNAGRHGITIQTTVQK